MKLGVLSCSLFIFLSLQAFAMAPNSIFEAAKQNSTEYIQKFIDEGVNVNLKDGTGLTALHYAAAYANEAAIQTLLNNEARTDLKDLFDRIPLHYAASTLIGEQDLTNGKRDTYGVKAGSVALLIKANRHLLNAQDNEGDTPLHYAIGRYSRKGWKSAILLLEAGANANIPNKRGTTPLHSASDKPDGIIILLANGAKINSKDHEGNTPVLTLAKVEPLVDSGFADERKSYLQSLFLLESAGANLDEIGPNQKSARQMIFENDTEYLGLRKRYQELKKGFSFSNIEEFYAYVDTKYAELKLSLNMGSSP